MPHLPWHVMHSITIWERTFMVGTKYSVSFRFVSYTAKIDVFRHVGHSLMMKPRWSM